MTDDSSQPEAIDDRIRAGDDTLIEILGHPVSVNEWHAVKLGMAGLFAGIAFGVGFEYLGLVFSLTLIGIAIAGRPFGQSLDHDHPEYDASKKVGLRTLTHEPWWFLGSYALWFAVGMGVV